MAAEILKMRSSKIRRLVLLLSHLEQQFPRSLSLVQRLCLHGLKKSEVTFELSNHFVYLFLIASGRSQSPDRLLATFPPTERSEAYSRRESLTGKTKIRTPRYAFIIIT